jgi:hypothetical protein
MAQGRRRKMIFSFFPFQGNQEGSKMELARVLRNGKGNWNFPFMTYMFSWDFWKIIKKGIWGNANGIEM